MKIFFTLIFSVIFFCTWAYPIHAADLPDRYIIHFTETSRIEDRERVMARLQTKTRRALQLPRREGIDVDEARREDVTALLRDPAVESIERDATATALGSPNDTFFSRQWALTTIQAVPAWDIVQGKAAARVAVLDSGVRTDNPDLQGVVVAQKNFTYNTDEDTYGHGTHVAGSIGAIQNNDIGITGVVPNAQLISVKVLDGSGRGYYSWIADGIVWAVDHGAKVINLSLGGSTPSKTLEAAVAYAWDHGAIVVAAAGNEHTSSPLYPAAYDRVIAVGATDPYDRAAWFSNYGSWVDIAAPGVSIYSTYKNSYGSWSGTSMATPFVSGEAALIASIHPDWTASMIRSRIENAVDIIPGNTTGLTKRMNLCKAVECIAKSTSVSPTPTVLPTPTVTPSPTPTPTPIPRRILQRKPYQNPTKKSF